MMTSLGNIESTHVAALTIPDFKGGSVLYLTGTAQNLFGQAAQEVMPRVHAVTMITVTGFRWVQDALPVRSEAIDEYSPYNPPIRYLAEENKDSSTKVSDTTLILDAIALHAPDLATFTFATSKPVEVLAGQYAIVDTTPLFGKQYAHMAMRGYERSVNDDGIRSWTISASTARSISLTMREMPHGKVTGALLALARGIAKDQPAVLADCSQLGVTFDLVGIGGSFALSRDVLDSPKPLRLLYVAAGIGVTPAMAILASLRRDADVELVWSIRDPVDVALDLVAKCMPPSTRVRLRVHLWVTGRGPARTDRDWPFEVTIQQGRVGPEFWTMLDSAARHVFLCGTPAFEQAAIEGLVRAGVQAGDIKRESFNF